MKVIEAFKIALSKIHPSAHEIYLAEFYKNFTLQDADGSYNKVNQDKLLSILQNLKTVKQQFASIKEQNIPLSDFSNFYGDGSGKISGIILFRGDEADRSGGMLAKNGQVTYETSEHLILPDKERELYIQEAQCRTGFAAYKDPAEPSRKMMHPGMNPDPNGTIQGSTELREAIRFAVKAFLTNSDHNDIKNIGLRIQSEDTLKAAINAKPISPKNGERIIAWVTIYIAKTAINNAGNLQWAVNLPEEANEFEVDVPGCVPSRHIIAKIEVTVPAIQSLNDLKNDLQINLGGLYWNDESLEYLGINEQEVMDIITKYHDERLFIDNPYTGLYIYRNGPKYVCGYVAQATNHYELQKNLEIIKRTTVAGKIITSQRAFDRHDHLSIQVYSEGDYKEPSSELKENVLRRLQNILLQATASDLHNTSIDLKQKTREENIWAFIIITWSINLATLSEELKKQSIKYSLFYQSGTKFDEKLIGIDTSSIVSKESRDATAPKPS